MERSRNRSGGALRCAGINRPAAIRGYGFGRGSADRDENCVPEVGECIHGPIQPRFGSSRRVRGTRLPVHPQLARKPRSSRPTFPRRILSEAFARIQTSDSAAPRRSPGHLLPLPIQPQDACPPAVRRTREGFPLRSLRAARCAARKGREQALAQRRSPGRITQAHRRYGRPWPSSSRCRPCLE